MTIKNTPLAMIVIGTIISLIVILDPANRVTPYVVVMGFFAMIILARMANIETEQTARLDEGQYYLGLMQEMRQTLNQQVDIWDYQNGLMQASDQRVEPLPCINKDSILYVAMQAEEFSEQVCSVKAVLLSHPPKNHDWNEVAQILHDLYERLEADSIKIREIIARGGMGADNYPLGLVQAIDILDGVTDLSVVTAGFSLASGLPAREAYKEVGTSNLSKANPLTGKIEKDPSGKWIKGTAYRSPDLASVLLSQADAHAEAAWAPKA